MEDDRGKSTRSGRRARGEELAPTLAAPPAPDATPDASTGGGRASRPSLPVIESHARYRLGEVVGQGGMGEVVLAFDEQLGREVVVKRILAEQPHAEEVARFLREARVQGRLQHPAVVPVHDLAVDAAGRPFFVMKRLAGTDLRELLARLRDGAEPDEDAARRRMWRAFVDVCLAVEFAHCQGIVHRDLKPANIMMGEYGEVYVLDWGVARATTEVDLDAAAAPSIVRDDLGLDTGQTRAGTLLGTPAYMAPEQLDGAPANPGTDIYALSCILYEIAAGAPLHPPAHSLERDATGAGNIPSRQRPDAPPEIDAICARATAADPDVRFPTARALGEAVQDFLDGDRDLAARRDLARAHVAEAHAALAAGHDEDARRCAMRAAGRALALDPTDADAAEVVTRLVFTPPTRVPAEVEARLEEIDITTGRTQARIGALAMTGYLGFVPLLLWTGVRDPAVVVAFVVFSVLSAGQVYLMSFGTRIPRAGIYLSACINAVLIGLVCRLVGPFMIAPTLVLTTLMAFAVHPRFGRIEVIAAILSAGVGVPWLLELVGWLSPTYHFADGAIVISSHAIVFSAAPVQVAFLTVLVALAAVVAVLIRIMARRQRAATEQIELQAWHLRQGVTLHGEPG